VYTFHCSRFFLTLNHALRPSAPIRTQVDKLVRVRRLLDRLGFLNELPERLEGMIHHRHYKEAVQLYNKTISVLTRHSHVLSFQKIKVGEGSCCAVVVLYYLLGGGMFLSCCGTCGTSCCAVPRCVTDNHARAEKSSGRVPSMQMRCRAAQLSCLLRSCAVSFGGSGVPAGDVSWTSHHTSPRWHICAVPCP
jgi:hypothetical protein